LSFAVENTGAAIRDAVVPVGCIPYDLEQRERLIESFRAANTLINRMVESVLKGVRQEVKPLESVAANYVSELTQDSSHVVASSSELGQEPKLTERSVRLAILGMAMAIEFGLDEENVRTVGVCGLVHDWGMFCIPESLRDPRRPLSRECWMDFVEHPRHTVELLERVSGVSDLVRVVACQTHECLDGSGYPTGRRDKIHLFARILNVADAYLCLTSEMRGRPALLSYDAMVCLLHQVNRGRLDGQAVRALLHVLSLFPIGSHVRLDDGSEARVLRANGAQYTRPIVQKLATEEGLRVDAAHDSSIIDLAESKVDVREPVRTPNRNEMRLDRERMNAMDWDGPES
jgi:HD-GYP domain-containing protein (c-di-GMP phosphodiesterase class II)